MCLRSVVYFGHYGALLVLLEQYIEE